ncbi:MAG: lytic transglycosylase domain-containing protein [Firmicutes bacterium]|jgi:soluble lytic murein transglycosylase|nr:lytic transglycosylase domain-containing protein [Bacillota bacterium]
MLIAYLIFHSRWYLRRVYPIHYKDIITQYSREHDVDPFLVTAVIRVESRFHPQALSAKGARGLMQVMPDTGNWIAGELGIGKFDPEMLYDPMTNLNVGTWYLAFLLREYRGDPVTALAAYNAGRGNVSKWIEERRWSGGEGDINSIPFPETREYVKNVLHLYRKYNEVYRGRWEE